MLENKLTKLAAVLVAAYPLAGCVPDVGGTGEGGEGSEGCEGGSGASGSFNTTTSASGTTCTTGAGTTTGTTTGTAYTITDAGGSGDKLGLSTTTEILASNSSVIFDSVLTNNVVIGVALGSIPSATAPLALDNTQAAGTELYRWEAHFDANSNSVVDAGEYSLVVNVASDGTSVAGSVTDMCASMNPHVELGGVAAVGAVSCIASNVAGINYLTLSASLIDVPVVNGTGQVRLVTKEMGVVSDAAPQ